MSRYDWPLVAKKQHRGSARLRWDDRTSGVMTERAVAAARAALSAAGSNLRAPQGDVNVWVPIGPSTVLHSLPADSPRGTGRVRDIAVSRDGMRAYAATAAGGVWYSSDAGVSWSPIGNWSPTPTISTFIRGANALSCGCLLVTFGTPADGSDDDVYVGTGEPRDSITGGHGDMLAGVGVLHLEVSLQAALANPFGNPWKREATNIAGCGIYRLARDPADPKRLVAATTVGLFTRKGDFEEDKPWTQIKAGPFDFDADDNKWTTDVLWTASGRLFVGLIDNTRFSDTGVHVSTHGVSGPFEEVDLDDIDEPRKIRIGLAVAPSNPDIVYVLTSGPKLWRITGTNGSRIQRVPKLLFGSGDQSEFDLTIAVDPRNVNNIILGGAGLDPNALLFACTTGVDSDGHLVLDFDEANQQTPTKDLTCIGDGVHADVHAAVFADVPGADAAHLWVATDGGIFRSTTQDKRQRFGACNTGLASLLCGFVANHPTIEGYVFTGTQDNSTIIRSGDTIWAVDDSFGGDAGCVLVHPVHSQFAVGHEREGHWKSNDSRFTPPVFRADATAAAQKAQRQESVDAAFYSSADIRLIGGKAQIVLGTNRVWLNENWRPTERRTNDWVTLPSGTDPYDEGGTDTSTDTLKGAGAVISCRWADDDRVVVLHERAVAVLDRDADGNWTRSVLSDHEEKCGDLDNDDIAAGTSEWVPPCGAWTDIAIYDNLGQHGRFYITTTGHTELDDNTPKEFDRMDTLWWYDRSGHFHPTGLRNHKTPPDDVGTEAPAIAVAVDPDDKNVVYVGTALGVWRGVLTFAGQTPTWKWLIFSNGLPETAVYDLAFFSHQGLKLLRAALAARGIWEMDLSAAPRPIARTYLRVHAFDTRRRALTSTINPASEIDILLPWFVSPDIRLRPAPAATAPPAPGGDALNWTDQPIGRDRFHLWTFQTAFRVQEPLCRPDGIWSRQFEKLLRIRLGQLTARIDRTVWEAVVTPAAAYQPPWGGGEPTEADLHELVVEPGITGLLTIPRQPELERRLYRVDVLVHHRDQRPARHDGVRVTLLRRAIPDDEPHWITIAISGTWKTRVTQLLSDSPPPGLTLPDGWLIAGTQRVLSPRLDVDARNPRVVTYDVNFGALTGAKRHFVLLAIVHSEPDPVTVDTLTGANLQELILFSHHVAARVVVV